MKRMPCMAVALCSLLFSTTPVFAKDSAEKPDQTVFRRMISTQLIPRGHSWHKSAPSGQTHLWAPSYFMNSNAPSESDRVLYVESTQARRVLIILEADITDFQGRRETLENVARQLGGQLRWAGNNRVHLQIEMDLSENGFAERSNFNLAIFKTLGEIQSQKIERDVAMAARLFHPARALYAEMGPRLEEMQTDPESGRDFMLFDNRPALRRYSEAVDFNCQKFLLP
jgi:hypothetical protein